ncbi:MAG: DegT/DnrJ/EryC1/StrS family aminotransferase, partial [Chloroflexota bacterium]
MNDKKAIVGLIPDDVKGDSMHISAEGLQPTPTNFALAEQRLLTDLNGDAVFWAGRAATLLYYAYKLAEQRASHIEAPEIIMPAMMCTTSCNVAHLAKMTPRFADIDPATGLVTLETLQARYTENTVAVVVIHLLGNTAEMARIATWCAEKGLLLIEDPTQAVHGKLPDDKLAGTYGDVTIYSFNRTKIIGAGNGVLVTRTPDITQELTEIINRLLTIPEPDMTLLQQLGLSYRNLHHSLVGLYRVRALPDAQISDAFMSVRSSFEPLFLRPTKTDVDLNTAWESLPTDLARRYELASIYADCLQEGPWELMTGFRESEVCWRFSLLIDKPEKQVAFSEAVRRDGFHVSNLYWAVNQFFRPSDECPHADSFGRRIVNLWVDASVDENYVRACSDSLLK